MTCLGLFCGIGGEKDLSSRFENDPEIHPNRPCPDIFQIQFDSPKQSERRIGGTAKPVALGETGDSGFGEIAE